MKRFIPYGLCLLMSPLACKHVSGNKTSCETNATCPPLTVAKGEAALHPADPSPPRLWRLTVPQLGNTVRSALGKGGDIESKFDYGARPSEGFGNESTQLVFDLSYVSNLETVLSPATQEASDNLVKSLPCDSNKPIADSCINGFLSSFGSKTFRRPLTNNELTRYRGLFTQLNARLNLNDTIAAVGEALLRSPYTQLRFELGQSDGKGRTRLTNSELATQLAFAITNAPPDETLRAANLQDTKVYQTQIRRLMATDAFLMTFKDFVFRWSGVNWIARAEKNKTSFPDFSATTRLAMADEAEVYLKDNFQKHSGNFQDFMTQTLTTITPPLASIYAVSSFSGSETIQSSGLQRSGFLTLPAVITANSPANSTGPIQRGAFLLRRLMCAPSPPPPANLDTQLHVVDPTLSLRERFAIHTSNPNCTSCHSRIDPFAFSLENFDPIGRFRTLDAGKRINATGTISGTEHSDTSFTSAMDLFHTLADSQDVQKCFVKQAFRYTLGRNEQDGDDLVLKAAFDQFVTSKLDMREIFYALYSSDAFTLRKEATP